jgi:hypothetical protein
MKQIFEADVEIALDGFFEALAQVAYALQLIHEGEYPMLIEWATLLPARDILQLKRMYTSS